MTAGTIARVLRPSPSNHHRPRPDPSRRRYAPSLEGRSMSPHCHTPRGSECRLTYSSATYIPGEGVGRISGREANCDFFILQWRSEGELGPIRGDIIFNPSSYLILETDIKRHSFVNAQRAIYKTVTFHFRG
ncbi:hypothetical protein AVEN_86969-1 [Araneus ventricosus]|uniref:Uncharacterized protein n=1 Tax=Araneus ventricosus TaxID=182803 RepID=A0A4Y2HB73_ARAVE|nr:hypothetical protein AVEN_86969-1 [Araneus ventricosus]